MTEEIGEEIVDVPGRPLDAIEALQLQACAISNESREKYFEEECLTKTHEL